MSPTRQILKLYWHHAWKYPKHVIGLLIMVPVALITFRLLPPLVAADILSRLSKGNYTQGDVWGSFGHSIILYSILVILGGIVAWRIVILLVWRLEGLVIRDLYQAMFNHLMKLDVTFHSNTFGGSLVSQANKLTGSYIRLSDTFVFQFYTLLISFTFVGIILYDRALMFVISLLVFSALFITFTMILSRRVRDLSAKEASAQNKTTGLLADAIANVTAVKSFSAIKSENLRFSKATENTRQRAVDVMWATTKRDLFASTITSSVQIMAVLISVIAVVVSRADISTVFLMLAYSAFMADRLWEFSANTLRNYNRSMGDARESVETLNRSPSIADLPDAAPLIVKNGSINFDGMNFAHSETEGQEDLFISFNLDIKAGEKIGLVGHSGSGKTSLTKLLLRFMDIDSGKILIDGQDISNVDEDSLRSNLAYVPQEPLLFHRSIKENIAYGRPNSDDAEIISAAKKANAHSFIITLGNGYETLVGERGVKLSGGQRQRIAIARAMLKDAPILVLDEATSALDSESEKLIQDALWKLMEGRTAIVIAHRLSTIQRMDRIIVLDQGQIIEQGSHKELLERSGTYARLWAHQSGGFLED